MAFRSPTADQDIDDETIFEDEEEEGEGEAYTEDTIPLRETSQQLIEQLMAENPHPDHEIPEMPEFSTWEEAVSLGIELATGESNHRWHVGWLANNVQKRYGKDGIGKFAKEIGMAKNTVIKYRWVARAWSREVVSRLPRLRFSHFQELTRRYDDDPDDALHLAIIADRESWSVEQIKRMLPSGKKSLTPFTATGVPRVVELPDGTVVVGLAVDGTTDDWAKALADGGLHGQLAKLTIKSAV